LGAQKTELEALGETDTSAVAKVWERATEENIIVWENPI
jgi:hypothetical protein